MRIINTIYWLDALDRAAIKRHFRLLDIDVLKMQYAYVQGVRRVEVLISGVDRSK